MTAKSYIDFYRKQGFSIVPIVYGSKKALIDWKDLQQRKLSDEEIQTYFFSNQPVNVGIICGEISGNLVVVDIDAGNPESGLEIAQKIFGNNIIGNTMIVKSRRGIHVYFRSLTPLKTLRVQVTADLHIDIQSEGVLIIAPPSKHCSGVFYTMVNPNTKILTRTDNIVEHLFERLREIYPDFTRKPYQSNDAKNFAADPDITYNRTGILSALKDCPAVASLIQKAKTTNHLLNEERVFLSQIYVFFGERGERELHNIMSYCSDYDEHYTQEQLENVKRNHRKPITCEWARTNNLCQECKGIRFKTPIALAWTPSWRR